MRMKADIPQKILRLSRKFATNPRPVVTLEQSVSEAIENKEIKPRHHPGILKLGPVQLPEQIQRAVQVAVQEHSLKTLCEQAEALNNYLKGRRPPPDAEEIKSKTALAESIVQNKYGIENPLFGVEEKEFFREKYKGLVQKVLKQHLYKWQSIEYDKTKSLVYLIGRSAAEYAVLFRIMKEISKRVPEFQPKSLLDFGSGVGTAIWAVNSVWRETMKEYFCVDSSRDMNEISSLIVRDGNANKDLPKGIFYRQFLPASHTIKFDIVISAYSLLELPSTEVRLETVRNLWSKALRYIVFVEQGTNAGFQVVNEARDYILHLAENASERLPMPKAHIFAPCPHDHSCPRAFEDKTPCNFEVTYESLPIGNRGKLKKELFSYVVLAKGSRHSDDAQWPRIVRPTLVRSRHTICRMCTASGKLTEVIFTASKHGKIAYRCARASKWGDLFPVNLLESEMNSEVNAEN
ncbi:methyltransferase-like protein 17, mitochondrial [Schistocerca piceifrons]|uniref:methyltransferase-like protein 17, mitochondrial n=1 Tax=Schistocerca piceifrons TaxID=274613 RepID=UPI001F5EA136|nr:methyltransferase-like protein 17, mitochondrial [Schistocerca piceifrons]